MKHLYLFLLLFAASMPLSWANVIDPDPDRSEWGDDTNKELTSIPVLSCDESTLSIYSEKALPSLYVYIVDSRGIVKYADVQSVSSCGTLSVDISQLPVGNYTVYLYSGASYMTASLNID